MKLFQKMHALKQLIQKNKNMRKHVLSVAACFLFCTNLVAQTTLISPTGNGGFETGGTFALNGWTVVNGTQTNKWQVSTGATAGFTGVNCAYISNSAAAPFAHAFTNGTASTVHFYRDVVIPAGQGAINLSFNWISRPNAAANDRLRVFLVPTTTTPVAGTALTATPIAGPLNNQTSWTSFTISLPCSYSGATWRLVFSWENDAAGGNNPPGGIDNISLTCSPGCAGALGTGVTSVASLPYASGAGTTCGAVDDITATNAIICGANWYYGGEDRVWTFTPTASGQVTIAVTSAGSYTGLTVYDGCPLLVNPCGASGSCIGFAQSFSGSQTVTACVTAGVTYYVVLDSWPTPTCNAYSNLTISAPVPPGSCPLGTGQVNVASLPYNSTGRTTCGKVDDFTTSNTVTCGSTSYFGGEDEVFVFTPTASGQITINMVSAASYTGMTLYNGCPSSTSCSGTPGTCVAFAQDFNGSKSMCVNVTAGTTYYLITDSWPSPTCYAYDISITAPSGGLPAGTTCANAPVIALPYNAVGHTTACYGNDYTTGTLNLCASGYVTGEDRVYAVTVASAQCIGITLANASTWSIGLHVYSGCPGAAGTTCLFTDGGYYPMTATVVLPAAGTYYIVIDTWASPTNATYDLSVASYGTGPANDLPCNATALTLGATVNGDNNCSGGAGEPATPTCWWAGSLNTVWYSVVCPASGQLKISTALGTIANTQIQVYSGTCGSLTPVLNGCNDNANACSGAVYYSSVSLSGLTPGATYWVQVDGYGNDIGTFTITATDGALPTSGNNQDCSGGIQVCSTVINQPTSFFGCGNIDDIPSSGSFGNPSTNVNGTNDGCMHSDELHSSWYIINISSNGNLAFTIMQTSGYYDWNLYPLTTNTCTDIANNLVAPVRCNWNCNSVPGTGMQTAGNIPVGSSACNFEAPLAVTAGQTYALCVSNFSGSTGGYSLNFSNSTAGIAAPTSVTWTGSTSTAWATTSNWGGCNPPSCTISALIVSSANQPVISVNTTVRDLTINPGATLTINPGITLTICGNLTNNGTLIASPTSTILFNNAAVVHNITGALTGTNGVGNLTITKTGGSVVLNDNIDIKGNFTTSNATSILNTAGRYIRVAGNFVNATGNTTFSNVGATGTLEFNGTAAQTYNQGSTNLDLNNVLMNHTGAGVTLLTNMRIKATTGTLTLTLGKIVTNAFEVYVFNTAPACVSIGNNTSYVEGFLRRATLAAGNYEFPVGEAVKGYERATVNFTAGNTANNLRANFVQYGATPAALGVTDCTIPYNLPALNCGKWIINAYDAALTQITGTGSYNMTLWPRVGSYTNGTAGEWTVMKDPLQTGAWALNGTCNLASTINQVMRTAMSGFSAFGVAQSTTVLPVELLSFTGERQNKIHVLNWETAGEVNNDYFALERSIDGVTFVEINRQDGALNSSTLRTYTFTDVNPAMGMNYYRLRQVNINGTYSFSNIVALEQMATTIMVSNIHPNPTDENMFLDITTSEETDIWIEVYDMYGKLVIAKKVHNETGMQTYTIETERLSQGVYNLRVTGTDKKNMFIHRIVRN